MTGECSLLDYTMGSGDFGMGSGGRMIFSLIGALIFVGEPLTPPLRAARPLCMPCVVS